MGSEPESAIERLWNEYSAVFADFDDLSLARWMSQTLSQLQGRSWRLSHPLLATYRLASKAAHDRQIWLKRLVSIPSHYSQAECCRAPLLPSFGRDVLEVGLICQHCGDTAVSFDELDPSLGKLLKTWADRYAPVHAVAHWDDEEQAKVADYDESLESAATDAERLLAHAGRSLAPRLLEFYPAVAWEDQDLCLEVRPEDIAM